MVFSVFKSKISIQPIVCSKFERLLLLLQTPAVIQTINVNFKSNKSLVASSWQLLVAKAADWLIKNCFGQHSFWPQLSP